MMTEDYISGLREKSFGKISRNEGYIFCDECGWNGFPNEKIIRFFHGLRPEDEDGFIYDYTEYDYNPLDQNRSIHVHKYNQKIIDEQLRISFENQKGVNDVKQFKCSTTK